MENIISIKDLSFEYENKKIFENINLEIKKNKWLTIIGNNGSGKSTLIKLILGLEKFDGSIIVDSIDVSKNKKEIRKIIGIVFADPDSQFILDSVEDELEFPLKNLNLSVEEIKKRKEEIITSLGLKKILKNKPTELSGGEKQLVALAVSLIINPKILILDEALEMLDNKQKEKVLKIIRKKQKKGMTIINITQYNDDSLIGDDVLVLDTGKIKLMGSKEEVFNNYKIFENLKLDLPFIVDLSIKLKYYDLVDKIYFDMEELVDDIWK